MLMFKCVYIYIYAEFSNEWLKVTTLFLFVNFNTFIGLGIYYLKDEHLCWGFELISYNITFLNIDIFKCLRRSFKVNINKQNCYKLLLTFNSLLMRNSIIWWRASPNTLNEGSNTLWFVSAEVVWFKLKILVVSWFKASVTWFLIC